MANEIAIRDAEVLTVTDPKKDVTAFEIPEGFICTISRDDFDGQMVIMNALNGSDSLAQHVNERLNITGIITTPGLRSRTGEVCTNTFLVLEDGTSLMSQSDGVADSARAIVAIFRQSDGTVKFGPDGVLPVTCIEIKLSNGNTMKKLIGAK